MDIVAAYQSVGTYRGAAELSGTTHKTVRRVIERWKAGLAGTEATRRGRPKVTDGMASLVAARIEVTRARMSAKKLLVEARAAGYEGSPRSFRRAVAAAKQSWRSGQHQGRRPGVWHPGEILVLDWGSEGNVHLFCAVLAWSRVRFVRFAADEKLDTTLRCLAECFEALGGVPEKVLTDRMGCLKGAVVANVVVPTAGYVRFATHYSFRPDFCLGADPESKGIVENLVGYAKSDLLVPLGVLEDFDAANESPGVVC